jgi:uncharacterized protein
VEFVDLLVKILCVSDTVVSQMENAAHLRRRYSDVDLLLSCGDMPAAYLEFITSVLNIPLFYVRGNHDTQYDERPPGGEDLHMRVVNFKGILFVGIEGSMKYNSAPIQYTDGDMLMNTVKLAVPIKLRGRRPDIFVTHNPAKGIHDAPDLPHNGFSSFLKFMTWYRPRYMLHGHVHTYDRRVTTITQYHETTIMNINPITLLEIEPEVPSQTG